MDCEDGGSVDVELLQVLAAKFEDAARIRVSRKDEMQGFILCLQIFSGEPRRSHPKHGAVSCDLVSRKAMESTCRLPGGIRNENLLCVGKMSPVGLSGLWLRKESSSDGSFWTWAGLN